MYVTIELNAAFSLSFVIVLLIVLRFRSILGPLALTKNKPPRCYLFALLLLLVLCFSVFTFYCRGRDCPFLCFVVIHLYSMLLLLCLPITAAVLLHFTLLADAVQYEIGLAKDSAWVSAFQMRSSQRSLPLGSKSRTLSSLACSSLFWLMLVLVGLFSCDTGLSFVHAATGSITGSIGQLLRGGSSLFCPLLAPCPVTTDEDGGTSSSTTSATTTTTSTTAGVDSNWVSVISVK